MFSEHAATRPAPSDACEQSLGFVYIPIPILTAPPSRLVWSRPSYSPRPVTAQIRPIPSRPDRSSRLVVVSFRLASPRLASSRFATARPYRQCGRAVTLIDRYRVTKYGPRPFLLERALWKGRRTKKKKSCCPDSLSDLSRLSRDVPFRETDRDGEKQRSSNEETRSVLGERTKRETDVPLEQDKCNCYVTLSFPVHARRKRKKKKTSVLVCGFCSKKKKKLRLYSIGKCINNVAFRFWHLRLQWLSIGSEYISREKTWSEIKVIRWLGDIIWIMYNSFENATKLYVYRSYIWKKYYCWPIVYAIRRYSKMKDEKKGPSPPPRSPPSSWLPAAMAYNERRIACTRCLPG